MERSSFEIWLDYQVNYRKLDIVLVDILSSRTLGAKRDVREYSIGMRVHKGDSEYEWITEKVLTETHITAPNIISICNSYGILATQDIMAHALSKEMAKVLLEDKLKEFFEVGDKSSWIFLNKPTDIFKLTAYEALNNGIIQECADVLCEALYN